MFGVCQSLIMMFVCTLPIRFNGTTYYNNYTKYLHMDYIMLLIRPYDAWGVRVDELVTSPAWKRLHDISAEEGLIALAYERKHCQWRYMLLYDSVLFIVSKPRLL